MLRTVERPTKFEFVINLRTAKAFWSTIPSTVLDMADEVIQSSSQLRDLRRHRRAAHGASLDVAADLR